MMAPHAYCHMQIIGDGTTYIHEEGRVLCTFRCWISGTDGVLGNDAFNSETNFQVLKALCDTPASLKAFDRLMCN
jgi:hypothetical protein